MNKFIILQRPKLRVPLWAGEDDWTIQLTETKAYSLSIFMEAFFASLLYDGGKLEVLYTYLRTIDKELSPYLAETFVDVFKQCHPATYLGADGASYKDIQLLSVKGRCKIPIYAYDMEITEEDEKKIVSAIIKFPDKIQERVCYWFSSTRTKYGIEYYPKMGWEQDDLLMNNFLRIHGLSEWHAKQTTPKLSNLPAIFFFASILVWIGSIAFAFHVVGGSFNSYVAAFGIFAAGSYTLCTCASNYTQYYNVPPKRKRR